MSCVEKIKHNVDTCESTSNSLQVFYDDATGKYTGYCFPCAAKGLPAYEHNPYDQGEQPKEAPKVKTSEEIIEEINEVKACPLVEANHRGIHRAIFKRAGVRLAFSEYDGETPFSFNFPLTRSGKLLGYKVVMLDKKAMWSVGKTKDCDLFNWEKAKKKGSKRLYITEGQWDCLALEHMLEQDSRASGKSYKYAVTSIPNGVKSAATTIGRQRKEILELFQEVVLVFDNDKEGQNAVREVLKVFPEILEAPHIAGLKDANDVLNSTKENQQTFLNYCKWKARPPLQEGVLSVGAILDAGMPEPVRGLSYPWEKFSDITYGQRGGEATCLAGAVGGGKTLMAHETVAHNILQHNEPCFVALLEEANHKTLWNIAGKMDSIRYNVPEVFEANREQFYETVKLLEGNLFSWSSQGNSAIRFDLDEILSSIRFKRP